MNMMGSVWECSCGLWYLRHSSSSKNTDFFLFFKAGTASLCVHGHESLSVRPGHNNKIVIEEEAVGVGWGLSSRKINLINFYGLQ